MNPVAIGVLLLLAIAPTSWAEDTKPESAQSGELQIKDLPKPIPELLERLQQLSRKIEPEITKLGSKLGEELDETVKKLREELQSRRHRESPE
jgi:gas vesicle protein